jgi:AcrR family transcriptional regulator
VSDRRTRLLIAAADVFAKRGFEVATVEEITRAAGVAKGSFYREFDSKEHVAVALQERFSDELISRASAIASRLGTEDILALADEFLEAIVDLNFEYRDIAAVLAKEASVKGHGDFANSERRMREIVTTGLRVGVAAGQFKIDDPETVAAILIHGVQGVLHHALLYEETFDRERILAAAKLVMRRTLGAG